MLKLMQTQGAKNNPLTLQLGLVQSGGKIKIGDLILEPDDYYIAKHLKPNCEVTYRLNGQETTVELVNNVLEEGDMVAIQKLNDTDIYIVLTKVVEA